MKKVNELILGSFLFVFILAGCQVKHKTYKENIYRQHLELYDGLKLTSELFITTADIDSTTSAHINIIEKMQTWIINKNMESIENAFNVHLTILLVEYLADYGPTLQSELHNTVIMNDYMKKKYSFDRSDWLIIYINECYPILCLTKLEVLKLDLVLTNRVTHLSRPGSNH